LRYHPDKQLSNDTSAFRKVNEAYKVLRNPLQRRKYDVTYDSVRRELETHREAWREYEKETEQQRQKEPHARDILRRQKEEAAGAREAQVAVRAGDENDRRARERLELT
jgi:curved DNA-binding protein CbpA